MNTIKETAGKVKDWVVRNGDVIAACAIVVCVGGAFGKAAGNMIGDAIKDAYKEGFNTGCSNTVLVLATENKDNPEIISTLLDFTSNNAKIK